MSFLGLFDSEAEKNRDKYKGILEDAENKLNDIKRDYDSVKQIVEDSIRNMKGTSTDSEGKIRTDLEDAIATYEARVKDVFNIFDEEIKYGKRARDAVKEQYEQYKRQAELEQK